MLKKISDIGREKILIFLIWINLQAHVISIVKTTLTVSEDLLAFNVVVSWRHSV